MKRIDRFRFPCSHSTFVRVFLNDEAGQDLVEYALVAAIIGLGTVMTMKNVSASISNAFNNISTSLSSNV